MLSDVDYGTFSSRAYVRARKAIIRQEHTTLSPIYRVDLGHHAMRYTHYIRCTPEYRKPPSLAAFPLLIPPYRALHTDDGLRTFPAFRKTR